MKRLLFVLGLTILFSAAYAQTKQPYEFKEYKRHAATSVKDQQQTQTCWAFCTASFLESEAFRLGKGETDLSEMYIVRNIYKMKCENYVRRQGTAQLSDGGLAHDYLNAVKVYGLLPESIYSGRKSPDKPLNHTQMLRVLKEKCKEFVEQGKMGKLDPNWLQQIDAILDAEFGQAPKKFTYKGAVFSPQSYRDFLGIVPDDYITVTSFTHHPFLTKFVLEIPDNWGNGEYYNLPLDDFMRCATYALEKGFTFEWDTDVSNQGFSAENGLAIVPESAWQNQSITELENAFKYSAKQLTVTQEYRQQLFDSQETADDHLMHVIGVSDEANTGLYYIVKNSWGETTGNKGYINASDSYVRINALSFTMHKSAIPQDLRRLLGLEPGAVNIETGRMPEMDVKPAPNAPQPAPNKKPFADMPKPQMRPTTKPANSKKE